MVELHVNALLIHKMLLRSVWISTGTARQKGSHFNKAVERSQARLKYLCLEEGKNYLEE